MGKPVKLPTPSWARDMHGETEVYTVDEVRAILAAAEPVIRAEERERNLGAAEAVRRQYAAQGPCDHAIERAMNAIRSLGAASKEEGRG